ncbi:MAG: ISKra4 family transposase [Thermomicrobiales bacterium]
MEDSTAAVVEAVLTTVLGECRDLATWLVDQREADLRTVEAGLLERGHALLGGLLGAVLAGAPATTAPVPPTCPACHAPAQRLGMRDKVIHLTLGDVPLARACGYCPACHQTWAPLDQQLGIDQSGRSPQLVEALALLGTELPFAPAAERLAQLCGVQVGPSQVAAVTEGAGRTLIARQATAVAAAFPPGGRTPVLPPVERRAPWVIIALDGVLVPHRAGHQEVRTGAVVAVRPEQLQQSYRLPWRYVVHHGAVATFGQLLWLAAYRQGVSHAARVIVLGDGAHWIWNLAEEHFPDAVHIVDLWHAIEHLWVAGRALLGDDEARVTAWVTAATARLKAGAVLELLAEWATLIPKDAPTFAAEVTYFRHQAARMQYDAYVVAGYPVGSGAVESANRHIVGVRVKQAGMRWTAGGVAGVLALRALLRSGGWDCWWNAQPPPVPLAA